MTWLTSHLLGAFGGTLLHTATRWWQSRQAAAASKDATAASVEKASYGATNVASLVIHAVLTLVMVGGMAWAYDTGQPKQLASFFTTASSASVAWLTGRLWLTEG